MKAVSNLFQLSSTRRAFPLAAVVVREVPGEEVFTFSGRKPTTSHIFSQPFTIRADLSILRLLVTDASDASLPQDTGCTPLLETSTHAVLFKRSDSPRPDITALAEGARLPIPPDASVLPVTQHPLLWQRLMGAVHLRASSVRTASTCCPAYQFGLAASRRLGRLAMCD